MEAGIGSLSRTESRLNNKEKAVQVKCRGYGGSLLAVVCYSVYK